MATIVTFNGLTYSIPAVNEEDWQSLSNYLIALAGAVPSGGSVSSNIRVSTAATTAVATTDYAVLINRAGPATVNLPAGVEKQVFVIADVSGAAATNNITVNRAGANTILGGTSYVLDRNNQVLVIGFSGGNWYRLGESLPGSLTSPVSTTLNGVVAFSSTDGKFAQDLGVGTTGQVLVTDGTTPSFAQILNANIDAAAGISYSKLNLAGSIVNSDINSSAGIEYTKLALTDSIVNSDINTSAAIAYSKLNLANSVQNTDIAPAAAIAYSKLDLTGAIVNSDISASAGVVYSKLDLTDSILNADINSAAGIDYSKLDLALSIVDSDIATSAAIDRTKLASGSASHVVVNDGSGVLSSVSTLPVSQGGTGLSALGSALQVIRVNSGATALEFATLAAGSGDVVGPSSSVTNGIVQFASTTGKALKDLGVGSANQVLLTDGTAPSFGAITNAYIDASAAIDFSKLAALTSGNILVGSAGNVATSVAMTGDVTISNTGVTAISAGVIVNADVNASAAIALTKLAATTANRALATDVSGFIVASTVTDTELGYLSGVTSAIQTQLDGKVSDTGDTMTGALTINTASNQLVLSSGVNQLTLNSGTSAAARTYTVPDVGTTANFVMTAGAQTIAGAKTFSGNLRWNSSLLFGNAQSNNFSSSDFQQLGSSHSQIYLYANNAANGSVAVIGGGYFNGTNFYGGQSNIAMGWMQTTAATSNSGVLWRINRLDNGSYTNTAETTALNTSTNLVTLLSGGNFGIGTSSPDNRVHIAAAANVLLRLERTDANNPALLFEDNSGDTGKITVYDGNVEVRVGGTGSTENPPTVALLAASTGAVTLGPAVTNNFDGKAHTVNGFIKSGNVTSVDASGQLGIVNNARLGGLAGQSNRTDSTTGGSAILLDNRSSSGLGAVRFFGNLPGQSTATTATELGAARFDGSWQLGTTATTSHHIINATVNTENGALRVQNFDTADANPAAFFRTDATGTTAANKFINFQRGGGAQMGAIVGNGTSAVTFGTYSDRRLKKAVNTLKNELEKILALNPCSFQFTDNSGSNIGFIAQELEKVYPDSVSYVGPETDEMKSIAGWDKTSARLVKAIQELNAKLEAAEAEIDALKGA